MKTTCVSSKGRVTIPMAIRKRLGISRGSKLELKLVRDHLELQLAAAPVGVKSVGFGLVQSRRRAAPANFDPATSIASR